MDGIDQVKQFSTKTLEWLPIKLPDNIKLILSVNEETDMHKEMLKLFDETSFIKMPLLGESEAKGILMSSVMQYNHSVNSKIQDCVLKSVQECTLPLYSKVAKLNVIELSKLSYDFCRYWRGKHRGGQIKNMT